MGGENFPTNNQEKEGEKKRYNIQDWAKKLKDLYPELSGDLDEDRLKGFRALEEMGLPGYKRIKVPIGEFLANPGIIKKDIDTSKFVYVLAPKEENLRRFSNVSENVDDLTDVINKNIRQEDWGKYELAVLEYFENFYGGTIVIGPEGQVYSEFKSGMLEGIDKGTVTPEFYAGTDKFTGSFKYSFEDKDLRQAIQNMLSLIPHEGEGREKKRKPGYYEFILTKKDPDSQLVPVFYDYNDNPRYQLPWNNDAFDPIKKFNAK